MKNVILFLLVFNIFFAFNVQHFNAEEIKIAKNSKSAIIIEESTGKILYESNAHEKRAMASMTKIMTMLLIMENLDKGNIKLTDEVYISKNASGMGGSQIFIEEGDYITVEDLLKGIAVGSANDASVAMAEYIGGTEENFVSMMNKKAKNLGLVNTNFKNSHGLDEGEHYTTAYEMAIMAKELLKYKEILKYTSIYEDYLIRDNGEKFWLVNTNKLIRFYKGIDGLKTGYTEKAGHCLTATMEKNGMRVITVVMESGSTENRSSDTVSLMEYAFSMYYANKILKSDDVLGTVNIYKGVKDKIEYKVESDVKAILSKQDEEKGYSYEIELNKNITAPINKRDVLGKLTLYDENKKIINEYNLLSNENVRKASFFRMYINNLRKIAGGNLLTK